jgi:hypothetical protein
MKARKINFPLGEKSLAARVQAMSNSEHRKFCRFLVHIELLGDVESAAKQVGISSKKLNEWQSASEISWAIEHALGEARRIAKGNFIGLWYTPEAENDWRFLAKLVSKNLKAGKDYLLQAAERNEAKFFIHLGKCLSGEVDSTLFDSMDLYIAGLLTRYPSITARDVVDQLRRAGYPRISEDNFRVRKQRLKGKLRIS